MIGVLTTSYPRFPDDAAGVFVRERVRVLLAEGRAVEVVAASGPCGDSADDGMVTRIEAGKLFYHGGAPEALEAPELVPRLLAMGQAARFSLSMLRHLALRGRAWDAVESHWLLPCGLLACAACLASAVFLASAAALALEADCCFFFGTICCCCSAAGVAVVVAATAGPATANARTRAMRILRIASSPSFSRP